IFGFLGSGDRRALGPSSAEFRGLEIVIRLDDLAQAILQRAIAAVRVRMVAFHEFLEARFDLSCGRIDLQPERIERLALRVADGARFRRGPLDARAGASAEFAQYLEWIARPIRMKAVCPAVKTHPPCRSMPGHGVLLVARDR